MILRSEWWLVAAMVAVVASFVTADLVAQGTAAKMDADARAVQLDAVPAVRALSMTRGDLHRLRRAAFAAADEGPAKRAENLTDVARARRAMRTGWEVYQLYPPYPGEITLDSRLLPAFAQLDRALDALTRALAAGEEAGVVSAKRLVDSAADRLDRGFENLTVFNANQAYDNLARIQGYRRKSSYIAYGFDLFSVALAVAATLLVAGRFRSYARSLERLRAVAETRANELDLFAGRVAHDILSPLGSVALNLELIRRKGASPETLVLVDRSAGGLQRARGTCDALLHFASAGAQAEPGARADLAEVLGEVLDDLRAQADEKRVDVGAPGIGRHSLAIAPELLRSVLANLLRNAIKYMGDRPVRHVTVRSAHAGVRVRILVSDTGPGIAADQRARIFELHVRAPGMKAPGLGLGLAIVKRIVEAHGGAVGVESQVGQGSTFWFELPSAGAPT